MPCQPDHEQGYIPGFHVRTDLALEATEVINETIPGVQLQEEQKGDIKISRVKISTPLAAQRLGKAMGNYVTLEVPGLRQKNTPLQEEVSQALAQEIQAMINFQDNQTALVLGLGNREVTPDALGPLVAEGLFVTRHVLQYKPEILGDGFRPVCALAPGVLGVTGIETGEILQGVVEKVRPDFIIAVDALAAQRLDRLHTTIQLSDTGISPGSGVGNRRMGINKETIGVPVFALGVPTVVDAVTITGDSIDLLLDSFKQQYARSPFSDMFQGMDMVTKRRFISNALHPYYGNLMVTPKEIDTYINDVSRLIAGALNAALHPKINPEDAGKYLH
ncbi:MAG: GPR endopeptidase [Firmicutes bacterium]|nr:GPR endopeptidase [Bacillota bacterium]